jgi:hypothetical protein
MNTTVHDAVLQRPVALHRSDFAFRFYVVYILRRFPLLTLHVSA